MRFDDDVGQRGGAGHHAPRGKGEETKEDDGTGDRMLFYVCCGVCVLVFCTTVVVLVCGIVKR